MDLFEKENWAKGVKAEPKLKFVFSIISGMKILQCKKKKQKFRIS